jgi:hypothetical protein
MKRYLTIEQALRLRHGDIIEVDGSPPMKVLGIMPTIIMDTPTEGPYAGETYILTNPGTQIVLVKKAP